MSVSRKKTKIVATLGPSCADEKTMTAMIQAGMNVARINFSHSSHGDARVLIDNVRAAAKKANMPVAVLQDLCGPKIRIGDFKEGAITLKKGARFTLTTKKIEGTVDIVSLNYVKLPQEVSKGMDILLNDGKVRLTVEKTSPTDIVTKVVVGGMIRSRRGVNVPDGSLSIPAITQKDIKDIAFGKEMNVDFVTLSFVRRARDIENLRKILGPVAKEVGIIAKIETREAVENIDEIIAAADGIMVARGDLAIEIPKEEVPIVQKTVILKCNRAGKPVITATQMLDSMKEHPVPTRAEVNDVANAIFDGTDAVMLSDETAVGANPALAIETMAGIALRIEKSDLYIGEYSARVHPSRNPVDAVTSSIVYTAKAAQASVIVAFSESGYTGRLVARHRPTQPILVLTPTKKTFAQTLLCFGCYPELTAVIHKLRDAKILAKKTLVARKLAKKGDVFVLGAGHPFGEIGPTNMMLVEEV